MLSYNLLKAIAIIALFSLSTFSQTTPSADTLSDKDYKAKILIVYYSQSGYTEKMAEGVVEGAKRVDSVAVILKPVSEVRKEDVVSAHALIIGSPTYYANMAAPVKQFIDDWFKWEISMFDKIGGAFATGGGRTAGRELVINSLLMAMLNNGMIVAGPLYESWGTFGASAITAPPDEGISEGELDDARRLGERIAKVTLRMKRSRWD